MPTTYIPNEGAVYMSPASRAVPFDRGAWLHSYYLCEKDSVYMESRASPVSRDLT